MTPKQEAAMVFREIKVGEYVLRFWPSDNGWMCGITPEMMQALAEPKEKYQYGTPLLDAMTGKTEQPANVAAVNTSSERVDKTAENVHEQPAQQQEPKRWAVFCQGCRKEWSVSYPHPGKSICADCDDKLAQYDTSPQPAQPSKPWVGLSTDEMKEIADRYHLKPPNVPVAFRAIEAKLREKNNG